MWGGEFGRTPTAEGNDGRDHNPHGFTWWLAGGGLKPGIQFGATDDYGYYAVLDRVHIHDLLVSNSKDFITQHFKLKDWRVETLFSNALRLRLR